MAENTERIIRGVVASGGIATGRAIRAFDPPFISFNFKLPPEQLAAEVKRFRASVDESYLQLKTMQDTIKREHAGESSFLIDTHLLILRDRLFVDRIVEKIESEHINAEWAIQQVSDALFEAYDQLQDAYLRERRGDLEDIVRRLLHNLHAEAQQEVPSLPDDTILVGKTISPSILFELRSQRVAGLVTETGTALSHTAIMARSLQIPAVMGTGDLTAVMTGELLIVDGDAGIVICSPTRARSEEYRRRSAATATAQVQTPVSPRPLQTVDNVRISLSANINFKEEVDAFAASGCESIGLYRTEFDFFHEGRAPSEEFLFNGYTHVLEHAGSRAVTFRTIDIGIDQKILDGIESNLRARGLRFCLENPDIFRTQLRALFRSSVSGNVRILLPFVSTVDDLDAALQIIGDVKLELDRQGVEYGRNVPIGVMIETPAAAQTSDLMASRVDFCCLGTNDLVQYYLVVDRSDQSMIHFYNPFHPAILRCLQQVQRLLEIAKKPVTVCGEMAGDPPSAAVLLALGFNSLSVSLAAYPRIQQMIQDVSLANLRDLGHELLNMHTARQIEERVRSVLGPVIT